MKKTKFFGFFVATMLFAGLFSSCLSNKNNDYEVTQTLPSYFNVVTDLQDGTTQYQKGISYKFVFNYTKSTVDITINGLRLNDGTSYPTLEFKGVPWAVNNRGWKEVSQRDLTPTAGNFYSVPVFDTFNLEMVDRMVTNNFMPCLDLHFTVNNKYAVQTFCTNQVLGGESTIKAAADGSVYTPQESPIYMLVLNTETKKADMYITGARFAASMPAMNMHFSGIDFDALISGEIQFSSSELIPSIVGNDNKETPYPNFPITNLQGLIEVTKGNNLNFTCTLIRGEGESQSKTSYLVTEKEVYPTPTTDSSSKN